jgi:inhibitor of cysteine peptidase
MVTRPVFQPVSGNRMRLIVRWLMVAAALVIAALAIITIVDVTRDGDVAPASVSLAAADDGRNVRVALDGSIVVRLESNPSTGYSWAVDTVDETILTLEIDTYTAATGGAVGQGGMQELQFRAAGTGQSDVVLKYWRPWEGDASIVERFSIAVTVVDR